MSLSTLVILWYKPKMPCATVLHYRMKGVMEEFVGLLRR